MKTILFICFSFLFGHSVSAQTMKVIGVTEFAEQLKQKNIQIVDCRTPDEYKSGYIQGATLADWNNQQQFADAAKKLDKSKPVYVYCLAGVRSAKAADWFAKNGFTNVYSLDGGIKAWQEQKLPLVKPN